MKGIDNKIAGLAVILALVWCCGCSSADDAKLPGWTGKVKGLVPDFVLEGPEIYKPSSVAFGETGNLYVLDAGNYRLYQYSASEELLAEVGRGRGGRRGVSLPDGNAEPSISCRW